MAIQMRRGPLAQYDESKMLAGEWGISIDADSNDQKAFIAFAPGVSKEVMMVEDAQEQIAAATAEAIVDATAKAEAYAHGDSFSVNDYASGDGTTTSFTLSETPSSVIAVYVDGAETTAYTRSGGVITFTTAPPVGEDNIRVYYTVNTTSDNAKYYKNQAASSASSASTSAQTATTQATNAANARQAIENMTATASSLPPGSAATVTKTTVSGVVNLAFGIPIGKDGEKGETSGIPVEEMTQAQYDALPEASKLAEKLYLITDGDSGWEAESVEYDNTTSGLTADNVQDAIDELSGAVDEIVETTIPESFSKILKLVASSNYTIPKTDPSGAVNITASNLGLSTPTGYTPIAIASLYCSSNNFVFRSLNALATGSASFCVLRNVSSSEITGAYVSATVLYCKTGLK